MGTWAQKILGHSVTWALRHSGNRGTRGTLFSSSIFADVIWKIYFINLRWKHKLWKSTLTCRVYVMKLSAERKVLSFAKHSLYWCMKLAKGLEMLLSWLWGAAPPIKLTFLEKKLSQVIASWNKINHFAWGQELYSHNYFACTKFNHFNWLDFHATSWNFNHMRFMILTRNWKFLKLQAIWTNRNRKIPKITGSKTPFIPHFYFFLMKAFT